MASVVSSMTAVFTEVFAWLQTALTSVLTVFYAEGQLTILGVLAVVGLAIAIFYPIAIAYILVVKCQDIRNSYLYAYYEYNK